MSIQSMATRSALAETGKQGALVTTLDVGSGTAGAPTTSSGPKTAYAESVAAWIPSEAVGLFLAFSGFFQVFDSGVKEAVLAAAVALVTVVYAWTATDYARPGRTRSSKNRRKKNALTAGLALLAYAVWWFATPGSFVTDAQDLDLDPFYPAILLALTTLGLPVVARRLGVDVKPAKVPHGQ